MRGYAAVKSALFPSIKGARTINKQLDEATSTTKSKRSETRGATWKNKPWFHFDFSKTKVCSMQGATRTKATKYIHDILHVWEHLNKQCKRVQAYQLISDNGEKFLAKGKLSKSFWWDFENDHSSLTRKKQGHDRAKCSCIHRSYGEAIFRWSSRRAHLDRHIHECKTNRTWCIWTGSIDNSCIFNHDKMPQFIDSGVSSSVTMALTCCGSSEKCEQMKEENRECVTIKPYITFDGEILMCHVIFAGTCI